MNDSLQALLNAGVKPSGFPPNSRYYGVESATIEAWDGTMVAYLRRRFMPPPERFALIHEHAVVAGDRPDNLAARYLGDPELAWRLADANNVLRTDELIDTVGSRLRITLPEGIPTAPAAGT